MHSPLVPLIAGCLNLRQQGEDSGGTASGDMTRATPHCRVSPDTAAQLFPPFAETWKAA